VHCCIANRPDSGGCPRSWPLGVGTLPPGSAQGPRPSPDQPLCFTTMFHDLDYLSANQNNHKQVAPGFHLKATSCIPGRYLPKMAGAPAVITISIIMIILQRQVRTAVLHVCAQNCSCTLVMWSRSPHLQCHPTRQLYTVAIISSFP